MDSIITNCRYHEIKYFEKILENLEVRSHFCIPNHESDNDSDDNNNNGEEDDKESDNRQNRKRGKGNKESAGVDSEENEKVVSHECLRSRQISLIREDSYIPECKENGEFQPMQCNRKSGSCFCVDEKSGEISQKSINGPGDPLPLCGLKALFTCEKLPSKLFCEADGTIAQKTERWVNVFQKNCIQGRINWSTIYH
uniref:Thyroglobulin type-1 domain-containing protein n=1 Tax=Panagrolaimus superbus TaxID=310955 RepID=A0A914Z167_9BILA